MTDDSRKGQKWIVEEFYKVLDVFGFRAAMFVEWGFRPADVKRTTERIKVPGDELCPLEDGEQFFDQLRCPKELWVYENETHTFGGRLPDFYPHVADWMRDALEGRFKPGHSRRVDYPAR